MKKLSVRDAVGQTLCHDVTAIFDGFKGPLFKRGHVIEEADVERLLDIGKTSIYVWEDNAGEVHEEDCARRFAAAVPVAGAHYNGPAEGKVMLLSDERGLFRVDTALLKEINSIPDVTVSALPDHYPVEPGARLASMRIVPLVTKEENVARMEALCASRPLLRLLPYRARRVGVIITGSEVYSGRIQDKFESVAREKLARYPAEIVDVAICDDDLDMLTAAARRMLDAGADMLLFHGGMSVDPDDLTPTAIRALGAEIVTYGVPAQPGNMSLAAYLGDAVILGVPSSAISNRTSMLDVMLPQAFTDERFTKDELTNLGAGGLCQQCRPCHFPNCTFGRY